MTFPQNADILNRNKWLCAFGAKCFLICGLYIMTLRWKTRFLCAFVLGSLCVGLSWGQDVPVIDDSDLREFKAQQRSKERLVVRNDVCCDDTSSTTTTKTTTTRLARVYYLAGSGEYDYECMLILDDQDLDAFTGKKRIFKTTSRRWIGTIKTISGENNSVEKVKYRVSAKSTLGRYQREIYNSLAREKGLPTIDDPDFVPTTDDTNPAKNHLAFLQI